MEWIIAVGLLLLFVGAGAMFNFGLLGESGMAGPWIATVVCVLVECIVICYMRVKEIWRIGTMLKTIGIFGLVQFIILFMVETPAYWKEDEIFIRVLGAWGFQSAVCLLGWIFSRTVTARYDDATDNLVSKWKGAVEKELEVLYEMDRQIVKNGAEYRRADHLAELLGLISGDDLTEEYKKFQMQKNETILSNISKLSLENSLQIDVMEKTLSQIEDEVRDKIVEKEEILRKISDAHYSRKDYPVLKKRLGTGR